MLPQGNAVLETIYKAK
jgi:hypothetical protein